MVRARDLGVPFEGRTGQFNAITDVGGIEVGHCTCINDDNARSDGSGRIRTGVTIIHPKGRLGLGGVAAGRAVINGTGEWTGMHIIDEIGRFYGPIALTGTGSIGIVHRAMTQWAAKLGNMSEDEQIMRLLAVVGETLDLQLHDVFNHELTENDIFSALDGARPGAVDEGNVGGGTGMMAYEFKGGIGTSSRQINSARGNFTVGALVQTNFGRREDLLIAGVRVGAEVRELMPQLLDDDNVVAQRRGESDKNSLLIVLATDAPLLPHQLQRLARRAALGIGRCGGIARNLSGEFALTFTTQDPTTGAVLIDDVEGDTLSLLFEAGVQCVEEAIINQLVASSDMLGNGNRLVRALPHDLLTDILGRHGRLAKI